LVKWLFSGKSSIKSIMILILLFIVKWCIFLIMPVLLKNTPSLCLVLSFFVFALIIFLMMTTIIWWWRRLTFAIAATLFWRYWWSFLRTLSMCVSPLSFFSISLFFMFLLLSRSFLSTIAWIWVRSMPFRLFLFRFSFLYRNASTSIFLIVRLLCWV
jgi:hypothetical protein